MLKEYKFLLKEIFYVLSGALFIFSGLELFWPSLVLAYININHLLILWFIVAIIIGTITECAFEKKNYL